MKIRCLAIILLFFFISCKPSFKVTRENSQPITQDFQQKFENEYYLKLFSEYNFNMPLSVFYIEDALSDWFELSFPDDRNIEITYVNFQNELTTKTFEGKFSKKGYFEFFHSKEKGMLPPFYYKDNKDRVRLSLNTEGNLLVDYYYKKASTLMFGFALWINDELLTRDAARGQEVGLVKAIETNYFED